MSTIMEFFTNAELKTAGIRKKKFASLMLDHFELHEPQIQSTPNGIWVIAERKD